MADETSRQHMGDLMQQVHLNNVELHKYLKRNRRSIDIEDIKKVCTGSLKFSVILRHFMQDEEMAKIIRRWNPILSKQKLLSLGYN